MRRVTNFIGGLIMVAILIIMDREIGQEEKMDNRKATRLMALVVGIFLALVVTCTGAVLHAQMQLVPQDGTFMQPTRPAINMQGAEKIYAPLPDNLGAITTCTDKNRAIVAVNSKHAGIPGMEEYALRHEAVHLAQIKRSKQGCRKFLMNLNKKGNENLLLLAEAEAYCNNAVGLSNAEYEKGMPNAFKFIHEKHGQHQTFDETIKLIKDKCRIWSGRSYAPG